MEKILFIGFSKTSTGEITYAMNYLSSCDNSLNEVLIVHKIHRKMLKNYKRSYDFHCITDFEFKDFIKKLGSVIDKYDVIFFIDLNAFFLEKSISKEMQNDFFSMLNYKVNNRKKIAAFDYLNSFVKNQEEYNQRMVTAKQELKKKTCGLSLNSKLNWYVSKIIPNKLNEQLLLIPSFISVFAPVPINNETEGKICFYNSFGTGIDIRKRNDNRSNILFGLSKYFINSINIDFLNILCTNVFKKICECISVRKIVCIDPIGCIRNNCLCGVEIISKPWIPKDEIFELLPTVLFTGAFVPNATIGTMSINCGIPFVSFIASESSEKSSSFKDFTMNEFPGFNSLGWWEDEVFFRNLTADNNYFETVCFADLCKNDLFSDLALKLETGLLIQKVDNYLTEEKKNRELPSFQQAINSWMSGEE